MIAFSVALVLKTVLELSVPAAASDETWRVAQAQPQPAQAQQPATPPPTAPVRTEIVRFESWTVTCNEFAEANRRRTCSAQLGVQQSNSNQVILSWTIYINDNKQFVMSIQTPTGVSIAPGVKLKIEKTADRTIPFELCDTGSCSAAQIIDNNLLKDLNSAQAVQVTIQAINGNQLNFNFPVKGIDKAITHLRSKL